MKKRIIVSILLLCIAFSFAPYGAVAAPPPPPAPGGFTLNWVEETITGANDTMEFSPDGRRWTAIRNSDPLDISRFIPAANAAADRSFRIRLRATGTTPASLYAIIVLPRRPAAPAANEVRFDGITETLVTTLIAPLEYRPRNAATWSNFVNGQNANVTNARQALQVRVRATAGVNFASSARSVVVPARRNAPNARYDVRNDRIVGVSTAMEWRIGGGAWTNVTASNLPRSVIGTAAATVEIRIRATATVPVSPSVMVDIPAVAPASSAPVLSAANIDFINETIIGVTAAMEFNTAAANAARWTAVTGTTIDISRAIPQANALNPGSAFIRYRGSAAVTASPATEITIPRRPAAPTAANVHFNGLTEMVNVSTPATMEYRIGTTGAFNPVPGGGIPVNVTATSSRIQVRYMATAGSFASTVITVHVPARGSAPRATYNASQDRIVGVTSAMEFSTVSEFGPWTAITANYLTRGDFGAATTAWVRVSATATAPPSAPRVVTIFAAPAAAPATPTLNLAAEIVTGVTNQMEYSFDGRAWRRINSDTLNISGMFPPNAAPSPLTLEIRLRATTTTAASQGIVLFLPQRPLPPTVSGPGTNVIFDGFTETVSADDTMEFRIGRTGAWTAVPGGATEINNVVATQQRVLQVRFRTVGATPASEIFEVTIPARRFPPNVTFDVRLDRIARTSSGMEFRFDAGTTGVWTAWEPITGTFVPRDQFGAGNALGGILEIRVAATATTPVGYIRAITIPPV